MQLTWLRPVYDTPGPYATVLLDATRATEDAAHEIDLRWRAARERLADHGAPQGLLDALEKVALTPTGVSGEHSLALVGAGERVLLARTLPRRPLRELAAWSPVPHLFPLVRAHAFTVPYVLVVADRLGADISVHGPRGDRLDELSIEGDDWPIRKVHAGGWSDLRYQHRVENQWEANADPVARELDRLVAEHRPQLILAAGDTRALQLLEDQLGDPARAIFVGLERGGRAAGANEAALFEEVQRVLAQQAAAAVAEVTDRFAQERGRGGGAAVEGLAAVVDALRKAQVDTLLLHDDPSSTARLWTALDQPLVLGLTRDEVAALGVDEPVEDRADAVLVRALAASDAAIVLVADPTVELADGVGALLRYTDASTPS